MLALLKKHNNREDGFTLIELLIVVLIIGILAAVAIPVYLGIQTQAHKSAIKTDVNQTVTTTQVALTEGATVASQFTTKAGSEPGENIKITSSTNPAAGPNDFMVIGSESTTGTPAGAVNYTYTYDSTNGQFTESNTATNLAAPALTLSFDSSNENFTYFNGGAQVATSNTVYYSGTGSLKVPYAAGNNYLGRQISTSELTVGKTYTVTVYGMNTTGGNYEVQTLTSGYAGKTDNFSTPLTANTWTPVTFTYTYAANDRLVLGYSNQGITYFDNITFVQQ